MLMSVMMGVCVCGEKKWEMGARVLVLGRDDEVVSHMEHVGNGRVKMTQISPSRCLSLEKMPR